MPRASQSNRAMPGESGDRRAGQSRRGFLLSEKTRDDRGSTFFGLQCGAAACGLLQLARRAMACEFSLFLQSSSTGAVASGMAALDEIERLEEKLSVFRPASEISRLNAIASSACVPVGDELYSLLTLAASLSRATGGAFDVATGALTRAWGFLARNPSVPDETALREALTSSGMSRVELDGGTRTIRFKTKGVELNLGSVGKGFAIDRAMRAMARNRSIRGALLDAGGSSIRAFGAPVRGAEGWTVAIGDPLRPGRQIAALRLHNRALGTSGDQHQFFVRDGRRYGHIIDPRTGWPAQGLASASVVAPTAAEADALSTAFVVAGEPFAREFCRRHPRIGAILIARSSAGTARPVVIGLTPKEVQL